MKSLREAAYILAISAAIGLAVNLAHPRAVAWSFDRPVRASAEDSLFVRTLPDVAIRTDVQNSLRPPRIISYYALVKLIDQNAALLIDARPLAEYHSGHLPQALALPFEELGQNMETLRQLPHDRWLIAYCDGPPCDLSHLLAQVLVQNEFQYVAVYDAGINDWKIRKGDLVTETGHE